MTPQSSFDVQYDQQDLWRLHKQLLHVPGGYERALKGAINKTLRKMRTEITRTLSNQSGIKQKAIRDQMQMLKPTRSYLKGRVVFGDERIPLIDLGARQTQKGVTFQSEGGERDLIPSAFVTTLGAHKGVFKRKSAGDGMVGRLPIYELFGPSVTGMFSQAPRVRRDVQEDAGDYLDHYTEQEVNRLLERYS